MFKSNQLEQVRKAKEKALKVFIDTKIKFENAIGMSNDIIQSNIVKACSMQEEVDTLHFVNNMIEEEIKVMQRQVEQINSIVGA